MRPEIHFYKYETRDWEGERFDELYRKMDDLRRKVMEQTGYWMSNSHFFIDGVYGKPCLSVLFSDDSISFWNAKNDISIGSFMDIRDVKADMKGAVTSSSILARGRGFTLEMTELICHYCDKIDEGLTMCNVCHKWVKNYKSYSFAGAACLLCYDPNKHLPPDSR